MSEKRYVITGAPCSGKTSVVDELERRGFGIVREAARHVLENEKFGSSIEELLRKERRIFQEQRNRELNVTGEVFLDRSIIDIYAYSLLYLGYIPREFKSFHPRYDAIFILEQLPLVNDAIRKESIIEAEKIHHALHQVYGYQGYVPIGVPIFPGKLEESVEKRADYILNRVQELKGGV